MARRSSSSVEGLDVWSRLIKELYDPKAEKGGTKATDDPAADADGDDTAAAAAPSSSVAVSAASSIESFALCVGMPGSGKSSLLNAYLNPTKEDTPKPTVALEYMFARRATAANAPKDIAHIWELGGGAHVSDLVSVPIGPHNFQTACYVIVVDLNRPSDVIKHLLHWTDQIKACVKGCVRELSKAQPAFAEGLKRRTYAKFGRDHADLKLVKPCPVPLVIVGNKYDLFKDTESAKRRVVGQALRFVAHANGATLLYCSAKEKALKDVVSRCNLPLCNHVLPVSSKSGRSTQ
jgi:dynein light intermediate chain 2, cytosolic